MRTILLTLLCACSLALADDVKLDKGVWKSLVQPNQKWLLYSNDVEKGHKRSFISAETYDVRKVGTAGVARVRWQLHAGADVTDYGDSDSGRYTQLAVTDAGVYILSEDMNDAAILEALKKKPSRSDPPKAYKGTKQNEGRYLDISNTPSGPIVCMGQGPKPGDGDCEDTCDGWVCVSPTMGFVELALNFAPDAGMFRQAKFIHREGDKPIVVK